ncbi:MAG: thioredoxin domain-containing protein [Ferrimicrobium sp.]
MSAGDDSALALIKANSWAVLVACVDSWCRSEGLEWMLHEVAETYKGRLQVLTVDGEVAPRTLVQIGVWSLPGFVGFRHGQETGRWIGMPSLVTLASLVDRSLVGLEARG